MALDPETTGPRQGHSIGQAARILGVNLYTLRDWLDAGKVPGLRRTVGGHRWITREGLLEFAKARGLKRLLSERRRAPRVQVNKVRVQLKAFYRGQEIPLGEGRLRDLSRTGFRVDQMKWTSPLIPAIQAEISFEVPHRGLWKGVVGSARVAWSMDNRRKRGASLGARLRKLEDAKSRRIWMFALSSASN